MVDALSLKHWDLGSIPRSPIFFNEFCSNLISCSVRPEIHHAPTIKACHMAQETNLKVRMRGPSYTSVDHATRALRKSTKGLNMVGQIAQFTSKRANKPPMFAFFSLFIFSLIYFNYIICFILIL